MIEINKNNCEFRRYTSVYEKLHLPYEQISLKDLFRIFFYLKESQDFLSERERVDLILDIRKLNPLGIFFKDEGDRSVESRRFVFFNNNYKFSTICRSRVYVPNLKVKNLEFEEIYPRILRTKIILDREEICENLIRKDSRFIIIDEEVFYNPLILEKYIDCDDIISEMIREIYDKFHLVSHPVGVDSNAFIFKSNNKYISLKTNNSKNDFMLYDLNSLKQVFNEDPLYAFRKF